jgi:hypothetical protein
MGFAVQGTAYRNKVHQRQVLQIPGQSPLRRRRDSGDIINSYRRKRVALMTSSANAPLKNQGACSEK